MPSGVSQSFEFKRNPAAQPFVPTARPFTPYASHYRPSSTQYGSCYYDTPPNWVDTNGPTGGPGQIMTNVASARYLPCATGRTVGFNTKLFAVPVSAATMTPCNLCHSSGANGWPELPLLTPLPAI